MACIVQCSDNSIDCSVRTHIVDLQFLINFYKSPPVNVNGVNQNLYYLIAKLQLWAMQLSAWRRVSHQN